MLFVTVLPGALVSLVFFFFFQAEDGIRDLIVTGVQTCALPISTRAGRPALPPVSGDRSPSPTPPRCRGSGERGAVPPGPRAGAGPRERVAWYANHWRPTAVPRGRPRPASASRARRRRGRGPRPYRRCRAGGRSRRAARRPARRAPTLQAGGPPPRGGARPRRESSDGGQGPLRDATHRAPRGAAIPRPGRERRAPRGPGS